MVDLALKNLLHDPLRFLITISGIAFSAVLILVQSGLFLGILSNASVTIERINADLWVTSKHSSNVDFAHPFSEALVDRVRAVPGVARADNLIVAFVDVALPSGAQENAIMYALEDFAGWGFPWDVREGDPRDLRRGAYLMIDGSATKRFGPFARGDYREIFGQRMEILGRTEGARSFTTTPIVFADYRRAQALQPAKLQGMTTYILVRLAPGASAAAVQAEVARRLPHQDVHTRAAWAARSRSYWVQNTGLGFNMLLTVFLGCLVGVVIVAQTLYSSTMENLTEYGTVKAIGGSNADIYAIVARQALIAAHVGFALGGLGVLAAGPLVEWCDLKLITPPWVVAATYAGTVAMCLGGAVFSFRKVAAIDPALVFRA